MRASHQVISDPALGVDYSRVVHGEQRFVHTRPIRAGDALQVVVSVENIRSAAGNDIISTKSAVTTVDGEPVTTAYSMIVVRGPAGMITYDDVAVGQELPAQSFPIGRADLVRYAGASGDFNPIHWNERFATSVGLPNVIAHGMYTMAVVARVVTDWAGDPGAMVEYGVRFTRPIVVPDPAGAVLDVAAVVSGKRDDGLVDVDLTATVSGQTVLAKARAVVRLPSGGAA